MLFIQSLVTLLIAYVFFYCGEVFGRANSKWGAESKRKSLAKASLISFAFALMVAGLMGTHGENCSRTDIGSVDCDSVTDFHPSKWERIDKFLATFSICFIPYLVGFKKGLKMGDFSEEEKRELDRISD